MFKNKALVHRGGRGQSFEYELLYDGNSDDGQQHAMGLLDVSHLSSSKSNVMTKSLGGNVQEFGVSLGGHWGGVSNDEKPLQAMVIKAPPKSVGSVSKCTSGGL